MEIHAFQKEYFFRIYGISAFRAVYVALAWIPFFWRRKKKPNCAANYVVPPFELRGTNFRREKTTKGSFFLVFIRSGNACLFKEEENHSRKNAIVCVWGGNGCARFCALLVGFGVGPKAIFRIEHPPPPAQKLQAHNFAYVHFRKKKGEKKWQQLFFPPLEGRDLRKAFF